MILTIDIGNTQKKYSLFKNETLSKCEYFDHVSELPKDGVQKTIVSNVKSSHFSIEKAILLRDLFQESYLLDMKVNYTTTLGDDRLASAYFVYKTFLNDCVVIDTGTFTTVDIVSKRSGFLGGYILPGFKLLSTCYNAGDLLYENPIHNCHLEITPQNTENAISHGLIYSFIAPIKVLLEKNSINHIVITGGNASILSFYLKNQNYKIIESPALIHEGLHLIAKGIV